MVLVCQDIPWMVLVWCLDKLKSSKECSTKLKSSKGCLDKQKPSSEKWLKIPKE
jgi:hypothetical protein